MNAAWPMLFNSPVPKTDWIEGVNTLVKIANSIGHPLFKVFWSKAKVVYSVHRLDPIILDYWIDAMHTANYLHYGRMKERLGK
jgi:hypothetical protein